MLAGYQEARGHQGVSFFSFIESLLLVFIIFMIAVPRDRGQFVFLMITHAIKFAAESVSELGKEETVKIAKRQGRPQLRLLNVNPSGQ